MPIITPSECKGIVSPETIGKRYTVRVARSLPEVEVLRPLWTNWQCHPNSDIDHYLTVLGMRAEFLRPHVVVVYGDGFPEAMLVGRLEQRPLELKIGYLTLFKLKTRSLTFVYGGLLGNLTSEGSEALAQEILSSLRHGEAELAYFNHLRADAHLYNSLIGLPGFFARDHFPALQVHRAMTLPGSVDAIRRRLPRKVRETQRRKSKRLLQDYQDKVAIDRFVQGSELDRMFADVEGIARKTYQRGLGVGFLDGPGTRRLLRLKGEKGWLRAFVLYLGGQPAAFWIGTLYQGTFHGDCVGYDPQYAWYSPGVFLMMGAIDSLCRCQENGHVSAIDFGLGDAQYKEELGDQEWQDASLFVFAPTIKGVALNLLRTPVAALDLFVKSVAQRTKLVDKVKRAWRNRLRAELPM